MAVVNGMIVGFGDIDNTGYVDHLFTHKDYQGKGMASTICNALENHAVENGMLVMSTHASITAKRFFERRGYEVIKEQQVERRGINEGKSWFFCFHINPNTFTAG